MIQHDHCIDCQVPFQSQRKHAKRCALCRALNNMKFVHEKLYTCALCGERFAPVVRGDHFCGTDTPTPIANGEATCGICKETRPRALPEIDVCAVCIRDPRHRVPIMRALMTKIKKQQAAYTDGDSAI